METTGAKTGSQLPAPQDPELSSAGDRNPHFGPWPWRGGQGAKHSGIIQPAVGVPSSLCDLERVS